MFWYEAVAIVAAATAALTEDSGAALSAPDVDGIFVDAEGNVTVRPAAGAADGSAARLARTLHALVPSGGTPAPLRLLVSKWIGDSEQGSIAEFARELAYFSRPDPASAVRAVYERCLKMPADEARREPATPVPAPNDTPRPKPRATRRRLVAAAAAAVSTAAAAGVWVAGGPPSLAGTFASFDLRAVAETVGSIRLREADAGQPSAGDGAAAATPAPGSPGTRPSVEASRTSPPRSEARREVSPARRLATVLSDARPPAGPVSATRSEAISLPPVYDSSIRVTAEPTRAERTARVYSIADDEIEPPSMVYPQLPPPVYAGSGAINSMEVIVSETGAVERVRLVSTPQRMTDMMLLSGAKTWKFTPASLNGEPVRYRMVVNWAATP